MNDSFSIVQESVRERVPLDMDADREGGGNPTPEERSEFVVERLAQFIRDGRTVAGMPFRQWQQMARIEIADAIRQHELNTEREDGVTKRLLFTFASAFVTIGFWGAAFSMGKTEYLFTSFICAVAGVLLFSVAVEWRVRKFLKRRTARKRRQRLHNVEDLNKRVRRMETEMEAYADALEKSVAKLKAAAMETAKKKAAGPFG